jgi:hypothetical protein
VHDHITREIPADPEFYLLSIFVTLFTGCLAIDEAARLWDVYVFEGDAVLVRAAVALLMDREMALLAARTVDDVRAALGASKRAPVGEGGAEDRWMSLVRDAGKA